MTKKNSNKKAKMEDEKTDEHVYQEIEENLEKSYTENAGTEEYPYSYADVSIEGNVSTRQTRQTTNKKSDKKTKMEDEKTDEHVYHEIEENLEESNTENTGMKKMPYFKYIPKGCSLRYLGPITGIYAFKDVPNALSTFIQTFISVRYKISMFY